ISRSSDWILTNRPSFDSSYREESNDMYYISVALILTELFRFEFYNKNLTLFTPISTLFRPSGGPGPDHFDPGGLISVSCIISICSLSIYARFIILKVEFHLVLQSIIGQRNVFLSAFVRFSNSSSNFVDFRSNFIKFLNFF